MSPVADEELTLSCQKPKNLGFRVQGALPDHGC